MRHVRMLVVDEEPVFTAPWWDLRAGGLDEERQRDALHTELEAELPQGHPLHGSSLAVIARSTARDDILVSSGDGRWAIVHLTWRGAVERLPWPNATLFDSLHDAVEALDLS
jgi:hypothetical protein